MTSYIHILHLANYQFDILYITKELTYSRQGLVLMVMVIKCTCIHLYKPLLS